MSVCHAAHQQRQRPGRQLPDYQPAINLEAAARLVATDPGVAEAIFRGPVDSNRDTFGQRAD